MKERIIELLEIAYANNPHVGLTWRGTYYTVSIPDYELYNIIETIVTEELQKSPDDQS